MLYRIADRTISPWVFYQTGVAILIWPVNAPQPIATVLTSRGTFSAPLIGVSEGVREVITWGNYRAQYSSGYVMISLWPPPRRYA